MAERIVCKRCVMDTSAEEISFDSNGICNFCRGYFKDSISPIDKGQSLESKVSEIKEKGRNKKYDCVIGVSGGVDSTYVAYLVKQLNLRPLAVHLDNGWNSELAVANIKKTLDKLDIPLHTHVLNWKEFRELQIAFLKASIPGMEIPTDHAITNLLYTTASKHGVSYIINGSNYKMEKIMPRSWSEFEGQMDFFLIKNVYRRFTNKNLVHFKGFNIFKMAYWKAIKGIKVFNILDWVNFDKETAMHTIQNDLGWVYYGGKHYESIYTRFTQAYIQPKKFGIDKRKAHYSNLICSSMMSRDDALSLLNSSPYPSEQMEKSDLEYFKKKLGFSDDEFKNIMNLPIKKYNDYPCKGNHWLLGNTEILIKKINSYLKR